MKLCRCTACVYNSGRLLINLGFSVHSCLSTDRDFEPPCEEDDDDEETIEVEEQQDGNDAESHQREIELLKEESLVPLDQLLSTLNLPQVLPQTSCYLGCCL